MNCFKEVDFKNILLRFFLLLLLYSPVWGNAKNNAAIWDDANRLYSEHKYDSAAGAYHQLLDDSFENAAIYYNLGNAYYRLGEYPGAILYYERALWQNRADQRIKDNLLLAKAKIQNPLTELKPIFFLAWWKNTINYFNPAFWAVLSFLLFLVFLAAIYLKIIGRMSLPYFERWIATNIILFLVSVVFLYAGVKAKTVNNKAVVMKERSPVFAGRQSSDTDIYAPAGTTVNILRQNGDQFYVSLPNGANGWISISNVEKVVED